MKIGFPTSIGLKKNTYIELKVKCLKIKEKKSIEVHVHSFQNPTHSSPVVFLLKI